MPRPSRTSASLEAYVPMVCSNPDQDSSLGFSAYEYLLEPILDLSPRIVIQKGAQIGATVMSILRAVWFLDVLRVNSMYLFPTHRSAARFSRGRFQVLLEHSPYLRSLFRQVKNQAHMRVGRTNFYCHGARSRVELMSTPVQCLTLDERDELYLGAVSSPQPWSAVELARQRLAGQKYSWELNLSTPTIPGHGVAAEYERSDQRRFFLLCPKCDGSFTPSWPDAITRRGRPGFRCQLCRRRWSPDARRDAIRRGAWRATHPERKARGYHLSQLIAPHADAERLLQQWRDSQSSPQALQVFHNSVLGLPYVPEGGRLDATCIADAIARDGSPMRPQSQMSVMGVDVGPNLLHVVIAEVSAETGASATGVGAASQATGLRLIWAGTPHQWKELPELLRRYRVASWVIDAMPETHQAREWVRRLGAGALCYYSGSKRKRVEQAAAAAGPVIQVERTESLDAMYALWRLGRIAAPGNLPAEFAEQLQSLVRVMHTARDGTPRADYLQAGAADHYAHALNYCWLAAQRLPAPAHFTIHSGAMLR